MEPQERIRRASLFPNPRTGGIWAHKALARVRARAFEAAGVPHISLYEGTKHSFATDAIRHSVPARHLQCFLGHASVHSTRRYARLAETADLHLQCEPCCRPGSGATAVPPVSREPSLSRGETRRVLGLGGDERPLVLLTMGGMGWDREASLPDAGCVFVTLGGVDEYSRRGDLVRLPDRSPVYPPDLVRGGSTLQDPRAAKRIQPDPNPDAKRAVSQVVPHIVNYLAQAKSKDKGTQQEQAG